MEGFPVKLSKKFRRSAYFKDNVESIYSIPAMLSTQSMNIRPERDSMVVFNHLRFIVYIVKTDKAQAIAGIDPKDFKQSYGISHVEVTPSSIKSPPSVFSDAKFTKSGCRYGQNTSDMTRGTVFPETI